MKKERHKDTDTVWVSYKAGRVFDDLGYPSAYWHCRVAYTWSHYRHAFWLCSCQVVGFGAVDGKVTHETEMASLAEVYRYLRYLRDVEACYKRVYGDGE